MLTRDRQLLSPQGCIVRTNCVDCLDRTNVVQTCVARWVLRAQLQTMGLCRATPSPLEKKGKKEEEIDANEVEMALPTAQAESRFRTLWARTATPCPYCTPARPP